MEYWVMRFLDRYVGIPICLLLQVYDRVIGLLRLKKSYARVNKILVIKFWGIGSIILASPTLKTIRENYPDQKIIFLTMDRNIGLYDGSGLFDEIRYFEIERLWKIGLDFMRLLAFLRKEKVDLVVDLEPFCRFSAIVSYLSGAPRRISYDTRNQWRGWLYTDKIVFVDDEHVVKNFLSTLKPLMIASSSDELVPIPFSSSDKVKIDELLGGVGVKENDVLIGFNINSSDFAVERRWPKENFAKVADYVIKKYGVKVVYIGLKVDSLLVERTVELMVNKDGVINLAGKTTLRELAYLMTRLRLFISNDSGPLHLAAAMKTPTFSFYGPETPKLYGPWGQNNTIFYKKLGCNPCINIYNAKRIDCKRNAECMRRISVEEVMAELESASVLR